MVMFVLYNRKGGSVNVILFRLTGYLDVDIQIGECITFAKHFKVYKVVSHILYNLIWAGKCYYLHFIDEKMKAQGAEVLSNCQSVVKRRLRFSEYSFCCSTLLLFSAMMEENISAVQRNRQFRKQRYEEETWGLLQRNGSS